MVGCCSEGEEAPGWSTEEITGWADCSLSESVSENRYVSLSTSSLLETAAIQDKLDRHVTPTSYGEAIGANQSRARRLRC